MPGSKDTGSLTVDTAQQMEPTSTGEPTPFTGPPWSPGPARMETLPLGPQGHISSTLAIIFYISNALFFFFPKEAHY